MALGNKFNDSDVLAEIENVLSYDNIELGLKPTYAFGNNDYIDMDISGKPMVSPLLNY